MSASRDSLAALLASSTLVLGGCGLLPYGVQSPAPVASRVPGGTSGAGGQGPASGGVTNSHDKASDVVLFALGLIETDYRFGGKNPEAGLDCSGMVSYVFEKSADMRLAGSAADLAQKGKPVDAAKLRPGDLVFFNTRNRPYSHVGIYIGDDRFVHAPSSRGKVRTESLKQGWYAARFEEGRSYFD
ncbi:MAG: NlpC/P60 family protein [Betaproteobacteria bacterium]|nr:NlpC/P60 family protein [Betaproteobacteria bacterium]